MLLVELSVIFATIALHAGPGLPAYVTFPLANCPCNNPEPAVSQCGLGEVLRACCRTEEGDFNTSFFNSRFSASPDTGPDLDTHAFSPDFPDVQVTHLTARTANSADPNDLYTIYFTLYQSGGNAWVRNGTAETLPGGQEVEHQATLYESGPSTGLPPKVEPSPMEPYPPISPNFPPTPPTNPGESCGVDPSKKKQCDKTTPAEETVADLGSIRLELSLGQTRDYGSAGNLILNYNAWSADELNEPGPRHLQCNVLEPGVERLWRPRHESSFGLVGYWLKQVVAPGTFVNIDYSSYHPYATEPGSFAVEFYDPNAVGSFISADPNDPNSYGYYDVKSGATPYITWVLETNRAEETFEAEKQSATGAPLATYTWRYLGGGGAGGAHEWKLTYDGLSGTSDWDLADPNSSWGRYRDTNWSGIGGKVHKIRENFGEHGYTRVLVQRALDPEGVNRVTSYKYAPNGRISQIVEPDGSASYYSYDANGRMIAKAEPWAQHNPTSIAGPGRLVDYRYHHGDPENWYPTSIKVSVSDGTTATPIALTGYTYDYPTGEVVFTQKEFLDPTVDPNSSSDFRSTVVTYQASNGRVKEIVSHNGLATRYGYNDGGSYHPNATDDEKFAYNPADPYANSFFTLVTITRDIADPNALAGEPLKATITEQITNPAGKVVFTRDFVVTASGRAQISSEQRTLDARGRVVEITRSNNTSETRAYDSCCSPRKTVDETGRTSWTFLDGFDRPTKVVHKGAPALTGFPAEPNMVTTYGYFTQSSFDPDGAGPIAAGTVNVVQTKTFAAGHEPNAAIHFDYYDLAERLVARVQVADPNLITTYYHEDVSGGGIRVTETMPNGATRITERHPDGRVKSITGTGVIEQHTEYTVSSGEQTIERVTGPTGGTERAATVVYDALGRLTEEIRPAPDPNVDDLVTVHSYYGFSGSVPAGSRGRLHKVEQRADTAAGALLIAPTVYVYDEVGNTLRTGLDGDTDGDLTIGCTGCGSGGVDVVSSDRVEETEVEFVQEDGSWFRQTTNTMYRTKGATIVPKVTRERLTGFASGQVAERIDEDIYGNETVTSRDVGSAGSMVLTTTTSYTATTATTEQLVRNGRTLQTTDRAGLVQSFKYDGLGRVREVTDSRGNVTTSHYEPGTGRLKWTKDDAGNQTSYAYDVYGRLSVTTDALDGTTRYGYDLRDQMTHIWGTVPQPVKMVYDDFGQRSELHTYRDTPAGGDWEDASWPGTGVSSDKTTWDYDGATGVLIAKTYADDNGTTYAYDALGRLHKRTWARGETTRYVHDSTFGDMTSVLYSDSTPDVTMTYLLTGSLKTVEDGAGKRTIGYDGYQRPETETFANGTTYTALYGVDAQLTTDHVDAVSYGIPQQGGGYLYTTAYFDRLTRLAFGTTSDDDATYEAVYGYDADTERLDTVNGPGLHSGGVAYVYDDPASPGAAGSNFVEAIEYLKNGNTEAKREFAYLTDRDLLEHTAMIWDPDGTPVTKSKYAYRYDELGRRTDVTFSGTAFTQTEHDRWKYNDRSELKRSKRFIGDPADPNNAAGSSDLLRVYQYDPIGNREEYIEGTAGTLYYCANELNQYDLTSLDSDCDPAEETFGYDLDGNLDEDADFTYEWDAENRLIVVESKQKLSSDDKKVTFGYDFRNRRIWKKVFDWDPVGEAWETTPSVHRKFVWYNWLMIAELDGSDDSVVRRYTWGLDLSGQFGAVNSFESAGGIGGLLAVEDEVFDSSTKRYLACYDGNGNLSHLVLRSDGTFQARYEYDAYGNIVAAQDAYRDENPVRFSTKYWDSQQIGYWGNRYFSCTSGRWLTRDSISEDGGILLFAYGANSPNNVVDFLGYHVVDGPTGGLPPVGKPTGDTKCRDCSDCWQTCETPEAQKALGTDAAGVICRTDGCRCACTNTSLLPGGAPGTADEILQKCALVHEEEHVWQARRSISSSWYYPCWDNGRQRGREAWADQDECAGYDSENRCLARKISSCNDDPCRTRVRNEIFNNLMQQCRSSADGGYGCEKSYTQRLAGVLTPMQRRVLESNCGKPVGPAPAGPPGDNSPPPSVNDPRP